MQKIFIAGPVGIVFPKYLKLNRLQLKGEKPSLHNLW